MGINSCCTLFACTVLNTDQRNPVPKIVSLITKPVATHPPTQLAQFDITTSAVLRDLFKQSLANVKTANSLHLRGVSFGVSLWCSVTCEFYKQQETNIKLKHLEWRQCKNGAMGRRTCLMVEYLEENRHVATSWNLQLLICFQEEHPSCKNIDTATQKTFTRKTFGDLQDKTHKN